VQPLRHSSASPHHSPSRLPAWDWSSLPLTCRRCRAAAMPHWRLCRSCWDTTFGPRSSALRPVGGVLAEYVAGLKDGSQPGDALSERGPRDRRAA